MSTHKKTPPYSVVYPSLLVFVSDQYAETVYSYLFTDLSLIEAGNRAEMRYFEQTGLVGSRDSIYVSDTPISGANESAGLEIKS